MAAITTELALELFKENGQWFGSPALLTIEPALITEPNRDQILDGWSRFVALQRLPSLAELWRSGKLPHHVFGASQRTTDQRKLLPRMLARAGHDNRAYNATPEEWRESAADIKAYLGLPMADCYSVFAQRHRVRRSYLKATHRHDPIMANRTVVRRIRQLIVTADETGEPIDVERIRKVVFSDHSA